jgi:hypothetical protein
MLGRKSSSLLAPNKRNANKISDSKTTISTASNLARDTRLTSDSMFHTLSPRNALSVQETPANTYGIRTQT